MTANMPPILQNIEGTERVKIKMAGRCFKQLPAFFLQPTDGALN